jgi:hypothetical protein
MADRVTQFKEWAQYIIGEDLSNLGIYNKVVDYRSNADLRVTTHFIITLDGYIYRYSVQQADRDPSYSSDPSECCSVSEFGRPVGIRQQASDGVFDANLPAPVSDDRLELVLMELMVQSFHHDVCVVDGSFFRLVRLEMSKVDRQLKRVIPVQLKIVP